MGGGGEWGRGRGEEEQGSMLLSLITSRYLRLVVNLSVIMRVAVIMKVSMCVCVYMYVFVCAGKCVWM